LGLHPELVASEHGAVDLWDRFFSETDFIGEVGLDGRPGNRKHLDKQSEVFEHVLQSCSRAGKKIVSVHSAGAVGTVLDLVGRNMSNSTVKIILHWFAGTVRQAERAVEMGCLFSINARMFNTKKWEALRSLIPLDRVFVETDSPFVEQRYVGRELDLIELTMERIATEMNVGRNDIGGILNSNFSLLFSPS
jgi:TatD DNase family protein